MFNITISVLRKNSWRTNVALALAIVPGSLIVLDPSSGQAAKKPLFEVIYPVPTRLAKNHNSNSDDACDAGTKGLILKYNTKKRFWICTAPDSGLKTTDAWDSLSNSVAEGSSPTPKERQKAAALLAAHKKQRRALASAEEIRHFHVDQNFKIFFRDDHGHVQNLNEESEINGSPLDITISGQNLTLTSVFRITNPKGQTSFRPFQEVHLGCENKSCAPEPASCAFHLKEKDDRAAVKKFDSAVHAYAREMKKKKDALRTRAFGLLDSVFLLAVSGNKEAIKRLKYFPLPVEGPAAEKVAGYQDSLRVTKALGCDALVKMELSAQVKKSTRKLSSTR